MRLALAQLNVTVGAFSENAERIVRAYDEAVAAGADLVAFPELAVTGYPPEDLVMERHFVAASAEALEKVAARTGSAAALVGFVEPNASGRPFNAAAVCRGGRVEAVYRKQLLPNYAVFDEQRYFTPGAAECVAGVGDRRVALAVCEDVWEPQGPASRAAAAGADLVVAVNASPYSVGRRHEREVMLADRAVEIGRPIAFVNLVGGQDELVFDGASVVVSETGAVVARAAQFREDLLLHEIGAQGAVADVLDEDPEVYEALVLGTRDYVEKNGFEGVLVGLSGGIDSSLVAAVAADALGAERVTGVLMPSRYSSAGSVADAEALVERLGIRSRTIPIEAAHAAFGEMLGEAFEGLAEENTQARIRGTTLMALSNHHGWLVLTTGNKSELAVGYATLYGDMAGGFAVVKDLWKHRVYALARLVNERAGTDVVPQAVLDKEPSAELRPDQRDRDSLPPYDVLDAVLEMYVEERLSAAEIEARGFDGALVRRVIGLVDGNEYKRRQAPPGVRVTPLAFGKDRRLPITSGWNAGGG